MTNEELNTELYQKMFAEQERYREELLSMSPEEVLDHAYEYTVREDLLLSLEYDDLDNRQAKALLKRDEPLKELFAQFESQDTGYMDVVREAIETYANNLDLAERTKSNRDAR